MNTHSKLIDISEFKVLSEPQLEMIETHRRKKLNMIDKKISNLKSKIEQNNNLLTEFRRFHEKRRKMFSSNTSDLTSTTIAMLRM